MICEICKEDFSTTRRLGGHISKIHKMTTREYYIQYISGGEIGHCKFCGKETDFIGLTHGFHQFCCVSCANKHPDRQRQIKEAMESKYGKGVVNPSQSESIKQKKKETTLKNYGVEHPLQSEQLKQKAKQTCIERWGCEYAMQNPEISGRSGASLLEKYGETSPLKIEQFREKVRETNRKKFGSDYASQNEEQKEKMRKRVKERLIDHIFSGNRLGGVCIPKFEKHEFTVCSGFKKYLWECCKCGFNFLDHLDNGNMPSCPKCNPPVYYKSKYEDELFEFLTSLNIVCDVRTKTILGNCQELDIFIPSSKLAIEFNGLYWHSEKNGKARSYHLTKTDLCSMKGIRLIHIFEDEWVQKKDVVKSIVISKLGISPKTVYARKCSIKKLTGNESFAFFEENHLQGYLSGLSFGLFDPDNELVSGIILGKSRYNKKYQYEIYRFCNRTNTNVPGSLSRLVSHFKREFHPNSIITYCDLRYGTGESYLSSGFNYLSQSPPNYFYFMNNKICRLSRLEFQKHLLKDKLKTFDPNLTEWQNMQLNGYDRIWDCGNAVYVWNDNERIL